MSAAVAILRKLLQDGLGNFGQPPPQIYVGALPANWQLPHLQLQQVSARPRSRISPTQSTQNTRSRVQVDVRAQDYPQLHALESALHALLHGYYGTVLQWHVSSIALDNTGADQGGGGAAFSGRASDFFINYGDA